MRERGRERDRDRERWTDGKGDGDKLTTTTRGATEVRNTDENHQHNQMSTTDEGSISSA